MEAMADHKQQRRHAYKFIAGEFLWDVKRYQEADGRLDIGTILFYENWWLCTDSEVKYYLGEPTITLSQITQSGVTHPPRYITLKI